MAKFETMEERLDRLESKVDGLEHTVDRTRSELLTEMQRLSDRVYGVEDRIDALNTKLDVSVDALRADNKLTMERLDGLREYMERSREEDRRERVAERELLFAIVRDHNRRLRAIERLEQRRHRA